MRNSDPGTDVQSPRLFARRKHGNQLEFRFCDLRLCRSVRPWRSIWRPFRFWRPAVGHHSGSENPMSQAIAQMRVELDSAIDAELERLLDGNPSPGLTPARLHEPERQPPPLEPPGQSVTPRRETSHASVGDRPAPSPVQHDSEEQDVERRLDALATAPRRSVATVSGPRRRPTETGGRRRGKPIGS